jgi:hypothetical protein
VVTGWLEPPLLVEPLREPLVRVATGLAALPEPEPLEVEPLEREPLECEPLVRVLTGCDEPPELEPAGAVLGAACEPLVRVVGAATAEALEPLELRRAPLAPVCAEAT